MDGNNDSTSADVPDEARRSVIIKVPEAAAAPNTAG